MNADLAGSGAGEAGLEAGFGGSCGHAGERYVWQERRSDARQVSPSRSDSDVGSGRVKGL